EVLSRHDHAVLSGNRSNRSRVQRRHKARRQTNECNCGAPPQTWFRIHRASLAGVKGDRACLDMTPGFLSWIAGAVVVRSEHARSVANYVESSGHADSNGINTFSLARRFRFK